MKKLLVLFCFLCSLLEAQVGFNKTGITNDTGEGNSPKLYNHILIDSQQRIIGVGTNGDNDGIVRIYDLAGNLTTSINEPDDGLDNPKAYDSAVLDSNERIIAVGYDHGNPSSNGVIQVYNSTGTVIARINEAAGNDEPERYYGVAVDSNDRIIAVGHVNTGDPRDKGIIHIYPSDAESANDLARAITENNGDNDPWIYYDVTTDTQNNIIAVGRSGAVRGILRIYSSEGVAIATVNEATGNDNAAEYFAVTRDSQGRIIAAGRDQETKGIIKIYGTNGNGLMTINEGNNANDPNIYYGVTTDAQDNIIAVGYDGGNDGVIKVYDKNGNLITAIHEADGGDNPSVYFCVAVDSQNKILAGGYDNGIDGVIKRYWLNGTVDSEATYSSLVQKDHYALEGKPTGLI